MKIFKGISSEAFQHRLDEIRVCVVIGFFVCVFGGVICGMCKSIEALCENRRLECRNKNIEIVEANDGKFKVLWLYQHRKALVEGVKTGIRIEVDIVPPMFPVPGETWVVIVKDHNILFNEAIK